MPPRLPAELFKYSKWAHAEALIRWGQIRVGTLDDYRNIEKHSSLIGDKEEGETFLFDNPLWEWQNQSLLDDGKRRPFNADLVLYIHVGRVGDGAWRRSCHGEQVTTAGGVRGR